MTVEKKLKRGLGDISPLFQTSAIKKEGEQALLQPAFDVQFLSVCVPAREKDVFPATASLASHWVRSADVFATLVRIAPGHNTFKSRSSDLFRSTELLDSRISEWVLSHQEVWSFTQNGSLPQRKPAPLPSPHPDPRSFLVFLEFEPSEFRSLSRLALLLDRLILLVEPRVESLREAYRLMKVFWNLNREIDFFLLFRERSFLSGRDEFLYEHFSLITSRFLGISPGWLGHLALSEKENGTRFLLEGSPDFYSKPILEAEGLHRPLTPEKSRFWSALQKTFQKRFLFP